MGLFVQGTAHALPRTTYSVCDWWWTVDRLQLAAIIALMLAGIILSLAASPPVATRIGLDPFHFFNRHVLFLLPSFIVLMAISFLSPRQIRRTALIVFAVSLVLIVATLLIGPEVKGSRRWIILIGVNIQASEFVKPAFVVLVAWLFAEFDAAAGNAGDHRGAGAAVDAGARSGAGARFRPDHADPDGVGRAVLHRRHADDLGDRAGGAAASGFSAPMLVPHVAGRIQRFMNPASGDTFQVDPAMEAFVHGGWFGLGPGEGIAKRSLPDSHTDFVFAVAAEEFGIVLCLVLLALFAFIVIRALSRAYPDEDMFARFAAAGLAILFGVQAAINMSVNLQLIPAKGMTLPFISYGGSSMVSLAYGVGMMLALTPHRPRSELLPGLDGLAVAGSPA